MKAKYSTIPMCFRCSHFRWRKSKRRATLYLCLKREGDNLEAFGMTKRAYEHSPLPEDCTKLKEIENE